jgi:6-pyruvoyl-tetrahydropterin synthase
MIVLAAVSTNIEAAHMSWDRKLHGHSYVVELWFKAGPDLPTIDMCWREIAKMVDHSKLEDTVGDPSMEGLAIWLLERASVIGTANLQVKKVVVRRPTLGYAVEATP